MLLLAATDFRCTNSDVLTTQPGQVTLAMQVSPASSPRFEAGEFKVTRVTFRPVDAQADAALGNEPYSFVATPQRVSLTNPDTVMLGSVPLADGVYRLERVSITEPSVTDTNPNGSCSNNPGTACVPPDNTACGGGSTTCEPATCLDGVLSRPGDNGQLPPPADQADTQNVSTAIDITGFTPPVTFRVPRGGQSSFKVILNGTAFFSVFASAFSCRSTGAACSKPSGTSSVPPPCISGYTAPTSDQLRPLLSFQ